MFGVKKGGFGSEINNSGFGPLRPNNFGSGADPEQCYLPHLASIKSPDTGVTEPVLLTPLLQDLDMASMARKVDPREAAAKRAAEEATRKALAEKRAREAADTKAAEMAAALKAVQKKEANEVGR